MDRLHSIHATLAEALRRRPRAFDAPVTVAEIYQDLVPYRAVRTALGFDMNADYEHTLLRLLAGEDELARLEPEEAREELRAELETPNPNVGLFRKFAGCDVWVVEPAPSVRAEAGSGAIVELSQDDGPSSADTWEARAAIWMDPAAEADDGTDGAEEPAEIELLLEDEVEAPPDEPVAVAAPESLTPDDEEGRKSMASSTTPEQPRAEAQAGACAFCDSVLPPGREVRYCPFCGMDQALRPCGACGEPLQREWRYCIACGGGVEA